MNSFGQPVIILATIILGYVITAFFKELRRSVSAFVKKHFLFIFLVVAAVCIWKSLPPSIHIIILGVIGALVIIVGIAVLYVRSQDSVGSSTNFRF